MTAALACTQEREEKNGRGGGGVDAGWPHTVMQIDGPTGLLTCRPTDKRCVVLVGLLYVRTITRCQHLNI